MNPARTLTRTHWHRLTRALIPQLRDRTGDIHESPYVVASMTSKVTAMEKGVGQEVGGAVARTVVVSAVGVWLGGKMVFVAVA